ncbi:hypothetical protein JKP88DRAFT_324477 [Tribonema minus]|uniref:Gamma-soluble NSF attachment protein n=1 Tax=Tribonema minus TaxID=303371 RepID=A0A836CBL3_9STRA|nr:hypothetical protein JKP88DRAFT_324477 [Tribonema minus]
MHAQEKNELFGSSGKGAAKPGAGAARPAAPTPATARPAATASAAAGGSTAAGSRTAGVTASAAQSAAAQERHQQQRREADEARAAAAKLITKTWKQWTCDFFAAAPLFERAAAAYRACGQEEAALMAYAQAGECQDENAAWPLAARDYREAAQLALTCRADAKAVEMFKAAATSWMNGAEPGKAGEYLGKAAQVLEGIDEDRAAEEYKAAADAMIPEGVNPYTTDFIKIVGARETLDAALRFLLGARRLDDALHVLRRYCIFLESERATHTLHRLFLTEAVVLLARGDYVAADAAYRDAHLQDSEYLRAPECKVRHWRKLAAFEVGVVAYRDAHLQDSEYLRAPKCKVEEDLLTAFKNYDADLLAETQRSRALLRLDAPAVRLAQALTIDGMGDMTANVASAAAAAASKGPQLGNLSDARARIAALAGGGGSAAAAAAPAAAAAAPPPPPPRSPAPAAAPPALPPRSAPAAAAAAKGDDDHAPVDLGLDDLAIDDGGDLDDVDLDAEIARAKAEAAAGDGDEEAEAASGALHEDTHVDDDDEIDLT